MAAGLGADAGAFFDDFYVRVFRFVSASTGASRSDVEDLVQETLLHAWHNRGQFRGDASPLTWVLAIARNRVRMRDRAKRSETEAEAVRRALARVETEPFPPEALLAEETRRRVRRALEDLDASYADLLVRRYFRGQTVRAIAEETGESEKAIESRLHRAREAFREQLKGGRHDE